MATEAPSISIAPPHPPAFERHSSAPEPALATPSSPSSTIYAPSPAFSTFSSSTFTSGASTAQDEPTSPPMPSHLNRAGSGSHVEVLQKEREAECAVPLMSSLAIDTKEDQRETDKSCGCGPSEQDKEVPAVAGQAEPAKAGFDRFGLPNQQAMRDAAECTLIGEGGGSFNFGSLVHDRGTVIVVFLRHLWCGLCAQYVVALSSATSHLSTLNSLHSNTNSTHSSSSSTSVNNDLTKPPLYIILISSGSPSLIPIYRSRLQCPFPLYVDKSRKLYKVFGMTRKTLDGGKEKDKGGYVKLSNVENVVTSVKAGIAMGAGLKGSPGNQSQLGGEFVLESVDGEIQCVYASRMSTTRNHSEVRDLFAAAGVHVNPADDASVFGTEE